MSKDLLIAAVGFLVITIAIVGIVVIEERGGPYEYELAPAQPQGSAFGSLESTGATGTRVEGQCVPPVGEDECSEPTFRLDLGLSGLSTLSEEIHFVAYLSGNEEPLLLGALERDGGDYLLELVHDDAHEDHTRLFVTMETQPEPEGPGPHVVYELDIPSGPERDLSLDDPLLTPSPLTGEVSVNQIGAVTVSATASARVDGLQAHPGFEYRAWLQANGTRDEAYTFLDPVEPDEDDPTMGTLDARVERVKVPDQERFLITLEPVAAMRDRPVGFPVGQAVL